MASIDDDAVSAAANTFPNPKKVSKAKKKKTETDVAGSSMAAPAKSRKERLQTPRKTHCANRFKKQPTSVAAQRSKKGSETPFPIELFDASEVDDLTDKEFLKQLKEEPYKLSEVPGMTSFKFKGNDQDDYDKVKLWIEKLVREDADGERVDDEALKIEKNSIVKCYELPIDIFTSSIIKPDVIVYCHNDKPIVLIENVSSPHTDTVIKMCWNLVHHLIWIRNSDTEITEWSGFVFPFSYTATKKGKSCVSQVFCTWNEKEAKFSFDVTPLVKNDVKAQFLRTLKSQCTLMKGIASFKSSITTSIPLPSNSDCLAQLGEGYYQLPSIQSILLANDAKGIVLKFPLDKAEREKLLLLSLLSNDLERLLRRADVHCIDELQFLLPLLRDGDAACEVIGDMEFFQFPMLIPPMSREEARSCLGDFYISVSEAISQLHTAAFRAHSDIRLENICFRKFRGEYKAVLIDLDRAEKCNNKFQFIRDGVSVMYPKRKAVPAPFTYENLDWYQLGVMLYFCLYGDDKKTYHEMNLKSPTAEPISTLLNGQKGPQSHDFGSDTALSLERVIKKRDH